jgi:hypothetical protein
MDWQPGDTAPKDGTVILGAMPNIIGVGLLYVCMIRRSRRDTCWLWDYSGKPIGSDPLWWQPMPVPPENNVDIPQGPA